MELNKTSGGSSIIPDRVLSAGNTTWVGSPVSNPSVSDGIATGNTTWVPVGSLDSNPSLSDGSPTPPNRVLNAGETTCPSVPDGIAAGNTTWIPVGSLDSSDGSPTPPNRVLNAGSPIRVLDAGKTTCPLVPGPRKKGTTILWWRISDSELMMFIDSRCTGVTTDVNGEVIKVFDCDNNIKYRLFSNGIVAMCGDKERCEDMLDALIAQEEETLDVHYLREAGVEYLRMNPVPPDSKSKSTFTICGWEPATEVYELYAIGDKFMNREINPGGILIESPLYGCGTGSMIAMEKLKKLQSKSRDGEIDKDSILKALIETCLIDYRTGGYLKVFHLKNGVISHWPTDLVDVLCKTKYTRYQDIKQRVFNDKNLLIFLHKEDQRIMGAREIYSFALRVFPGEAIKKGAVKCLWVSDHLVTFLVEMETSNRKRTLIRHLQQLGGVANQALPSVFKYRNLCMRRRSCYYFMAQAEKITLFHAKNATSFVNLRELVTRRPQV